MWRSRCMCSYRMAYLALCNNKSKQTKEKRGRKRGKRRRRRGGESILRVGMNSKRVTLICSYCERMPPLAPVNPTYAFPSIIEN